MPCFSYSVETGQSTQVTSEMADSRLPAFDRDGNYLYFTASTNAGATSDGLDMTSDLYDVTSNIYAVVLAAGQPSPVAPELDDEKTAAEIAAKAKDSSPDSKTAAKDGEDKAQPAAKPPVPPETGEDRSRRN